MSTGRRTLPAQEPRPQQGGERPLDPAIIRLAQALARDMARRDHAAALAAKAGDNA
jgi:hypothetical protein